MADNFKITISNEAETLLTIVSVKDKRTGFVVKTALPHNGIQTASISAFAGARYSRSADSAEDIFREIKMSGKDANEKLALIFKNYGHASVADMALLFGYIEQVPDCYHVEFFYNSRVGAGQVRSTRYQDFTKSYPPLFENYVTGKVSNNLSKRYLEIFNSCLELNKKYIKAVEKEFRAYFKPDGSKMQESALMARVFDTARAFLPLGVNTSLAYITSAREWARIISHMKADNRKNIQYLGDQLEFLFAPPESIAKEIGYTPEAPDLIRHTSADYTQEKSFESVMSYVKKYITRKINISAFKEYDQSVELLSGKISQAEMYLYQLILTEYPDFEITEFKSLLKKLTQAEKVEISNSYFKNFNHHSQLGRQGESGAYSFKISATYAELKDLNRHRAWARFAPIWETTNMGAILDNGYILPLYLKNEAFGSLRAEMKKDLETYYAVLNEYFESLPDQINKRIILNLLPSAHRVDYYMHASPKEISYMTNLRVRSGGHINYRVLAYVVAQIASEIDPLLSGLKLGENKKPDPFSREEFFDRS